LEWRTIQPQLDFKTSLSTRPAFLPGFYFAVYLPAPLTENPTEKREYVAEQTFLDALGYSGCTEGYVKAES
jgi:hypothetical protein